MATNIAQSGFMEAIEEDVEIALRNLANEDTQYNRRTFIKTFYSFLEGLLHSLRCSILDLARSKPGTLTVAEMAVLGEETYAVNARYQIETNDKKYLTFEQSFRLTLRYYFRLSYDCCKVDFGDGGWQALIEGLTIRNRITHPKRSSQMAITEMELATVKKAKKWTQEVIYRLFREQGRIHDEQRLEIHRKIDELNQQTKASLAKAASLQGLRRRVVNNSIKYGTTICIGFIGDDIGVEEFLKKFYVHGNKKYVVIDSDDEYVSENMFPVRFLCD